VTTADDETPSFKLAENQMERQMEQLQSALREGKMKDHQADEIIRLVRAAFRQRSAIRRAMAIAKRGQFAEASSILEAELETSDSTMSDEKTILRILPGEQRE
jgi:hypothetical protein